MKNALLKSSIIGGIAGLLFPFIAFLGLFLHIQAYEEMVFFLAYPLKLWQWGTDSTLVLQWFVPYVVAGGIIGFIIGKIRR